MAATETTRDRIVTAATAEFAQYGIAGARVERIARAARTSKERVYAYFHGKDELYRFVAGRELAAMSQAVPLDATDLPGYATRLHDHVAAHPEQLRLMKWGQLELTPQDAGVDDPFTIVLGRKVETIRRAQADGALDSTWDPMDVLVFVSQLATSTADQTDQIADPQRRETSLAARRDAIRRAVQRIFPAAV